MFGTIKLEIYCIVRWIHGNFKNNFRVLWKFVSLERLDWNERNDGMPGRTVGQISNDRTWMKWIMLWHLLAPLKMNASVHLQFYINFKFVKSIVIFKFQITSHIKYIRKYTYVRRRYNPTAYWHLIWIFERIFGFMHSNIHHFPYIYIPSIDI